MVQARVETTISHNYITLSAHKLPSETKEEVEETQIRDFASLRSIKSTYSVQLLWQQSHSIEFIRNQGVEGFSWIKTGE